MMIQESLAFPVVRATPTRSCYSLPLDAKVSDHICYFFHDPAQQLKVASAYIAQGLQNGERCLYIAVDQDPRQIKEMLLHYDICADEEIEKGDLHFLTKHETYLVNGTFSQKKMIDDLRQVAKQVKAENTPVLRVAGEMSWALEDPQYLTEVVEYELQTDCFFLKNNPRLIGLCQYNTLLFPPSTLTGIRLAHRVFLQDLP